MAKRKRKGIVYNTYLVSPEIIKIAKEEYGIDISAQQALGIKPKNEDSLLQDSPLYSQKRGYDVIKTSEIKQYEKETGLSYPVEKLEEVYQGITMYEDLSDFISHMKNLNAPYKRMHELWREYIIRDKLISKGVYPEIVARLSKSKFVETIEKNMEEALKHGATYYYNQYQKLLYNINRYTLQQWVNLTREVNTTATNGKKSAFVFELIYYTEGMANVSIPDDHKDNEFDKVIQAIHDAGLEYVDLPYPVADSLEPVVEEPIKPRREYKGPRIKEEYEYDEDNRIIGKIITHPKSGKVEFKYHIQYTDKVVNRYFRYLNEANKGTAQSMYTPGDTKGNLATVIDLLNEQRKEEGKSKYTKTKYSKRLDKYIEYVPFMRRDLSREVIDIINKRNANVYSSFTVDDLFEKPPSVLEIINQIKARKKKKK